MQVSSCGNGTKMSLTQNSIPNNQPPKSATMALFATVSEQKCSWAHNQERHKSESTPCVVLVNQTVKRTRNNKKIMRSSPMVI